MDAKRGYVPEDKRNFSPEAIETLKTASRHVCYLLGEGYDLKQATVFVGNHFLLSERQRLAITRSVASKDQLAERGRKRTDLHDLAGKEVWIDGFNTIITLEVLLSDSLLFQCMDETIRALGKSLSKQSIAIIPKIKELDVFLNTHPEFKNKILESHPEVVFSRLNGAVVVSRKKEFTGILERERILSDYLEKNDLAGLWEKAKEYKCNPDDLMDAACLTVAGALHAHGLSETIPGKPEADETGLYMQLTVPRKRD